jgi:hypothetical protein
VRHIRFERDPRLAYRLPGVRQTERNGREAKARGLGRDFGLDHNG